LSGFVHVLRYKDIQNSFRLFIGYGFSADRFEGVEWTPAGNGSPILSAALAYMECTVKSRLETSDHWITYAEVVDGNVAKPDGRTAAHHRKIGNYY
jgi:flavin reductase (DIM6/NTAB) family NADH-FMN oxidoreductase RutF